MQAPNKVLTNGDAFFSTKEIILAESNDERTKALVCIGEAAWQIVRAHHPFAPTAHIGPSPFHLPSSTLNPISASYQASLALPLSSANRVCPAAAAAPSNRAAASDRHRRSSRAATVLPISAARQKRYRPCARRKHPRLAQHFPSRRGVEGGATGERRVALRASSERGDSIKRDGSHI